MKLSDLTSAIPEQQGKTIVVPFPYEDSVLRCLEQIIKQNIAKAILVGERKKIEQISREHGINLSDVEFIEETEEGKACETAVAMALDGRAQVLMKGIVQTASFMRAILQNKNNLVMPGKLLSMVAVFEIPAYPKLLLLTDPAVNIHPTLEQKKQIIMNAIEVAHCIGIPSPKVACVESIEKVNPKIQGTLDAQALKELGLHKIWGEAEIDGPFGFDVAISPEAAKIKDVTGTVAGNADIILLPDLASANTLYKSFVWFGQARVANIIAGVRVPIVITSRSDSEEAKFLSVALAVYVASKENHVKMNF